MPYVVLDYREDAVAAAKEHGDLLIEGNATEDEDLRRAGHRPRARASSSPPTTTPTTSTSRSRRAHVRPDIQIVARASDEDAEKKLKLAGADRVVMPYTAAGRTMANLVLKPQVTAFLDAVTTATGPDLHMAEIEVHETCANAGKTIRDIRVRHETGAIIVALRKRDGTFDTTPEPDARDRAGRRDRRRRHDRGAAAPRGSLRRGGRCRLIPSARSPARSARRRRSSGRATPSTATTRRTRR